MTPYRLQNYEISEDEKEKISYRVIDIYFVNTGRCFIEGNILFAGRVKSTNKKLLKKTNQIIVSYFL